MKKQDQIVDNLHQIYIDLRLQQHGLDKNLHSSRSEFVPSVCKDKEKKHEINWRKILKESS